jgi:FXSXX-COOH protein
MDEDWAPLIDVTDRSMVELLADDSTALAQCVDRLLQDLNDPDGVISAFNNYAS